MPIDITSFYLKPKKSRATIERIKNIKYSKFTVLDNSTWKMKALNRGGGGCLNNIERKNL